MIRRIISAVSVCALIAVDQWTKWLAVASLKNQANIDVIAGVFRFKYVENPGAAFGFFDNMKFVTVILSGILLLAALIILFSGKLPKNKIVYISGVLIVAGGIGNWIDRVSNGFVVDFLDFNLINFPTFNLADCFVVVGAILLLIFVIFIYSDDKDKPIKNVAENTTLTKDGGVSDEKTQDSSDGESGEDKT